MRRAELCHLRTEDIDKERMVVRIRQGKGGKDREVPLSPKLLAQLRTFYRSLKRKSAWIFPSVQTRHHEEPMTTKTVWHACREAARRAGITKPVHPHTLRHCFATHLLDSGAELPVIQTLLGHSDPRDTMIYLHLSTRHLRSSESAGYSGIRQHLPSGAGAIMSRPILEVADILRAWGGRFIERSHARLSWPQYKVMRAIERCRTAALGKHRDRCTGCGHDLGFSFNSCLMGSFF